LLIYYERTRPALHLKREPASFFSHRGISGGNETAFCSFDLPAKYLSLILSAQQVCIFLRKGLKTFLNCG
jgi:hypothetical protein